MPAFHSIQARPVPLASVCGARLAGLLGPAPATPAPRPVTRSAGTRGARSTEELVRRGYAVIFVTRHSTTQPFALGLTPVEAFDCLADAAVRGTDTAGASGNPHARDEPPILTAIRDGNAARDGGMLHIERFSSVFDYLVVLRHVAESLAHLGPRVMFYLAAAVSDFYIPWDLLAEHKIQSREGDLNLSLRQVPKVLGTLRQRWAAQAFLVSFKLETDEKILLSKARGAIQKYGSHAVVANLLHNRKDRVYVLRPDDSGQDGVSVEVVDRAPADIIEEPLIAAIEQLHAAHVARSNS